MFYTIGPWLSATILKRSLPEHQRSNLLIYSFNESGKSFLFENILRTGVDSLEV
jgi:hypothetical protein